MAPLLDAVDRSDVGMVQRGQHLRLALESLHAPHVLGKGGRQDLDGHLPMEFGIGGTINGAHAALAELGGDLVVADADGWAHRSEYGNRITSVTGGMIA